MTDRMHGNTDLPQQPQSVAARASSGSGSHLSTSSARAHAESRNNPGSQPQQQPHISDISPIQAARRSGSSNPLPSTSPPRSPPQQQQHQQPHRALASGDAETTPPSAARGGREPRMHDVTHTSPSARSDNSSSTTTTTTTTNGTAFGIGIPVYGDDVAGLPPFPGAAVPPAVHMLPQGQHPWDGCGCQHGRANTHDAEKGEEEDASGWASPEEVHQLRALTHSLIEKYQGEITKLSAQLQRTQAERDQYLEDILATRELKSAYVHGQKLVDGSREERHRAAEEREMLRLQLQKLLVDNEALKLALARQKQQQQQRVVSELFTAARQHHRARKREGASDDLPSPASTLFPSPASPAPQVGEDHLPAHESRSTSHSMPAAVSQLSRYMDLVNPPQQQQHHKHARSRGQEGGGDGGGAEGERLSHRVGDPSSSFLETPTFHGTSGSTAVTSSSSRHDGEHARQPHTRAAATDTTRAHAESAHDADALPPAVKKTGGEAEQDGIGSDAEGRSANHSSIPTPSPSDGSLSQSKQSGPMAPPSSHPEYARGASQATTTTTTATERGRVEREWAPARAPRADSDGGGDSGSSGVGQVPFPAAQGATHAAHPQQPRQRQRDGKAERARPSPAAAAAAAAAAEKSAPFSSSASPCATPSSLATASQPPTTASSSLALLYHIPRTPAEALASEARLLHAVKELKNENTALQSRVALLETLLANAQTAQEHQTALLAHENEVLKRRQRAMAAALADAEAARDGFAESIKDAKVDGDALRQQLVLAEAALAEAKAGEEDRRHDAIVAAKLDFQQQLEAIKVDASARCANSARECAALQHEMERRQRSFDDALKTTVAAAHEAERALAEERRQRKALAEELHTHQQQHATQREAEQATTRQLESQLADVWSAHHALQEAYESEKAHAAHLQQERHLQEDEITAMRHQLSDSVARLLEWEEMKDRVAHLELHAEEEKDARERAERALESEQRVWQQAMLSLQEERDAACTALEKRQQKLLAKYTALKIRWMAVMKGETLEKGATSAAGGMGTAALVRKREKKQAHSSAHEGGGGDGGGQDGKEEVFAPAAVTVIDARAVLRASTEAAAQLARSIHRG